MKLLPGEKKMSKLSLALCPLWSVLTAAAFGISKPLHLLQRLIQTGEVSRGHLTHFEQRHPNEQPLLSGAKLLEQTKNALSTAGVLKVSERSRRNLVLFFVACLLCLFYNVTDFPGVSNGGNHHRRRLNVTNNRI